MKNKQTIPPSVRYAVLLFAVLALSRSAEAQSFTSTLIEGGQAAEITGYTGGNPVDLVIPNTGGGKPVKSIGFGAFSGLTTLRSVTFPASLVSIKNFVFLNCSALTQVTFPASVDSIGAQAFGNCGKLETALFEGHAPNTFGGAVFNNAAPGFKVQFYGDANGFTTPVWEGYPSERLTGSTGFAAWRTRFGFGAGDLTARNGDPLLIAYALNLDPTDSDAFLPLPFVRNGRFRLNFTLERSDVLLQVERTGNPVSGTWRSAAVTTNSGTGTFSLPLSGSPEKLYLRFTAEQTE